MQMATTATTINKLRHDGRRDGRSRQRVMLGLLLVLHLFVTIIKGETDSAQILSRQRRYLVFPEGSSLQLVYDEAIPIVDYTLLVVTGETMALAYELPHKPLYGDEIWRTDDDETLKPNATRKGDYAAEYGNRVQDSYYFGKDPRYNTTAWQKYYRERDSFYKNGGHQSPWSRLDWDDSADRLTMDSSKDTNKAHPIIINRTFPFNKKNHIVALPMGKRSIDAHEHDTANQVSSSSSNLEASKEFYLQHHRSTRYKLYKLIDIYLRAHGQNGVECVLKTLCEVGQRARDAPKESFMAEIVRAIFRLPDTDHADEEFHHYHRATRSTAQCSELFAGCAHSIWTASFLL